MIATNQQTIAHFAFTEQCALMWAATFEDFKTRLGLKQHQVLPASMQGCGLADSYLGDRAAIDPVRFSYAHPASLCSHIRFYEEILRQLDAQAL